MLVRLGIAVDPYHAGGVTGQHIGPVALAARHVEHDRTGNPRGDPFVHRQMPAIPVVLGGDVGERALTVQLERRDSRGLVLLYVQAHRRGA